MPDRLLKLTQLYQALEEEDFLPGSGSSLVVFYLIALFEAEESHLTLNKSTLMNSAPYKLGSPSRRRYLLEFIINSGAASSNAGLKKSEKIIRLTPKAKAILDRLYA